MERNNKVFKDKTTPNVVILARVDNLALEHNTHTQQIYTSRVSRHPRSERLRAIG